MLGKPEKKKWHRKRGERSKPARDKQDTMSHSGNRPARRKGGGDR